MPGIERIELRCDMEWVVIKMKKGQHFYLNQLGRSWSYWEKEKKVCIQFGREGIKKGNILWLCITTTSLRAFALLLPPKIKLGPRD